MPFLTPTLLNQSAAASSSAAPSTFTNTITSTTAGTTLVALVALAASGASPTITTPANWTLLGSLTTAGSAIAAIVYAYPNNPGGITTVVFAGLASVNGIATHVSEWQGMPLTLNFDPGGVVQNVYATATTAPAVTSRTPVLGNVLWIGALAALTGLSLTAANVPSAGIGAWTALTATTSTTGATNVNLQPFYSLPGPQYPAGTGSKVGLAGTTTSGAAGASMIGLASLAAGALLGIGTSPYGSLATGQGVGEGVGL